MEIVKRVFNRLIEVAKPHLRKEIVELFCLQTMDIINGTPYSSSYNSIHLCPADFLGYSRSPELIWMREVETNSAVGRALSDILEDLKSWHLTNLANRDAQISASTAKLLVVKQPGNKHSRVPPAVGDIVILNTNRDDKHLGQIVGISRQTAKVLSQDQFFYQPLSYLTPLYTEEDEKALEVSQNRKQNVVGNIIKLNGKSNNNPETIELTETKAADSDNDRGNEGGMLDSALGKEGHLADETQNNDIIFEEPENNTSDMTNGLINGLT